MTDCAPAAMAFVRSPEKRTPPSATIGTPNLRASAAHQLIALICGTPTPVTTRVVQIEPGPMPTFTASTPASHNSFVASAVATLPAMI
jgi:hypothetical protein